jgi:hypothetical protein
LGVYPGGVDAYGRTHAIGSLGLEVQHHGEPRLLTAAHVVGALSEAADGSGHVSYVAGVGGASSLDRMIGRVTLSHPADPAVREVELDAALVTLESTVTCENIVRDIATSRIARNVEETAVDDNPVLVHKRGFASGETTGLLDPVPQSLDVAGKRPDGTTVVRSYLRGYFVEGDNGPFARPGDSGSIVIDDDDCVVGMIVALRAQNPSVIQPDDLAFVVSIVDIAATIGIELVGPSRLCVIA